ncbi:MAG: YbaN family protein [Lachnospiraceae bacterium]|nr:YbaN family protein [Lachnospiraceae bacterium]HJC79906.1 YbaN family protein [Candidatus Mediterraneibacter excrementipullorum]
MKKNPVRIVWLLFGFLSMGIGAVGVVLPVLPATPFLLLASFCLAKGSERFHKWFTGTKLYKRHLDSFVKNRAMTLKTKFSLLIPASCMLLLAFLAMRNVYGRVFIVFLIVFKYVYFFTKIRTIPAGQKFVPETEG